MSQKHPPVSRSPRRAGQRAPTPDAAEIRARSIALGTDEARAGGGEALQRRPACQPTFWSFLASSPQGSSSGASPMAPRATSELWRNVQDFFIFRSVTNCPTGPRRRFATLYSPWKGSPAGKEVDDPGNMEKGQDASRALREWLSGTLEVPRARRRRFCV